MLFPKFSQALEAVLYIALHSGSGPVSSKKVCEYQGELPRHLEPLLQALVKEGILKGTKGPKGGYTLAKEKRRITLAEIFGIFLNITNKETPGSFIRENIMNPMDKELVSNIVSYLDTTTIEDLCKEIEKERQTQGKPDFNI